MCLVEFHRIWILLIIYPWSSVSMFLSPLGHPVNWELDIEAWIDMVWFGFSRGFSLIGLVFIFGIGLDMSFTAVSKLKPVGQEETSRRKKGKGREGKGTVNYAYKRTCQHWELLWGPGRLVARLGWHHVKEGWDGRQKQSRATGTWMVS